VKVKIAEYVGGNIIGANVELSPGGLYLLEIKANRILTAQDLNTIVVELNRRIGWGKVKVAMAREDTATVLIEATEYRPTGINVALILMFLPQILAAIGAVLIAASLYMAVASVPSWIIALGIIGMLMLLPTIFGWKIEIPKEVVKKTETRKTAGGGVM